MIPAVRLPPGSGIPTPIDVTLKRGWRFDGASRAFVSAKGERFVPGDELPKQSRILAKVPSLAHADRAALSTHEKELTRYVQIIVPKGVAPSDYVERVRKWPGVAEAHVAPEISLPGVP